MTETPVDRPRSPQLATLDAVMHAYDREVEHALAAAMAAGSGTDRVVLMHDRVGPALVVHDTVLSSALCPALDRVPGGSAVADRVRRGCRARADTLRRFDRLTRGVAAHNVYGVSADEVDDVLQSLDASFREHRAGEVDAARDVLSAAGAAVDTAGLARRMAAAARRAPTRPHGRGAMAAPPALALAAWRRRDRIADWFDAHHGWSGGAPVPPSPRRRQMAALQRLALGAPATVQGILTAYDTAVEEELAGLDRATTDTERGDAAHRATAAVAIHDAVVGGVVCPLLRSVPGGAEAADTLRRQCEERAVLLRTWVRLTRHTAAADVYRRQRAAADAVIVPLRASFAAHEDDETTGVTALLEDLPPQRFRTAAAPFADSMWPWHSEGPNLLALRMARWADRSPSRPHPLVLRHPGSRLLRSGYGLADHLRDRWHDTPLTRWLAPPRPGRPFSAVGPGGAPDEAPPAAAGRPPASDGPPPG